MKSDQATSGIARRRELAKADGGHAYQERRNEIRKAAANVFKEKGFSAVSLGDIAAVLGIDRASLYYYVKSKEELFNEVVQEAVEANVIRAESIRDGEGSATEKIRNLARSLMASYEEHYPYLYVYIQEDMSRVAGASTPWARAMRSLNSRYEKAVLSIVESGLEEGTLNPVGPPKVVADALIGMINWSHRWFKPKGPLSAEDIGETFAELVLTGLAPKKRDPADRGNAGSRIRPSGVNRSSR